MPPTNSESVKMNGLNRHAGERCLRVLAGLCLLLCGSCTVYFLGMDLDAWQGGGSPPPPLLVQALCILGTALAAAFFALPGAGRR